MDNNRSERLRLDVARNRLSVAWFSGAGITFVLLMFQSLAGKYGSDTQQVWSWYVPSTVPTLSLILSVLGAAAIEEPHASKPGRRYVSAAFFRLAMWLTGAYLLVLFATVIGASLRP